MYKISYFKTSLVVIFVLIVVGIGYLEHKSLGRSKEVKNLRGNSVDQQGQQNTAVENDRLAIPRVDTSNWKSHHNEKYGFYIEYPSDWKVRETDDPRYNNFRISFAPEGYPDFRIGIVIRNETSLHEIAGKSRGLINYTKDEIVVVNGREILKVTYFNTSNDLEYYTYGFEHGGNVYTIASGSTEKSSDFKNVVTKNGNNLTEVFERMFASFRFTQ